MWQCKHCEKSFELDKSGRANHSRWCDLNPKRNEWNSKQGAVTQFGLIVEFVVCCNVCDKLFKVKEREKLHPLKDKYFCSRRCSNSIGGQAKATKYGYSSYVTIAFKHHKRECVVCGFDKIVEVHHANEDHNDNRPENLVPLCPNHHQMYHTIRYRDEVKVFIDKYIMGP